VPLTAWAFLMIAFGLWSIVELPGRFAAPGWFFPAVGVVLVAMGEFIAAITAERLFPGADRRVTVAFEGAAWVVVLGVVAAVATGVLR
jgi:hypothetical protein